MIRSVARALLLASLGALPCAAAEWHVDASGACPGNGTLDDPFCAVQAAIDAASDGDVVLVQPGLYVEAIDFLGKAVEVTSVAGAITTILESPDGSSVVTLASGEGPGSILRGFTIRGGVGTPLVSPFGAVGGGGVLCLGVSAVIDGNTIVGNGGSFVTGGGLLVSGGAPAVRHNLIIGNSAASGAGMACLGGATPLVSENVFRLNGNPLDTIGGGVFAQFASPTLTGNTFEENASSFGGGYFCDTGTLDVRDNLFEGNTAATEGGAISVFGSSGTASGNTFRGNGAGNRGGAVSSMFLSDVDWIGNVFSGNVASEGGAAASYLSSSDTYDGDVFTGNTATSGAGAALWLQGALVLVKRADVRGNRGFGGAVRLDGSRIVDSVVAENDSGVDLRNGAAVWRCTVARNTFTGLSSDDGANVVVGSIAWGNGTDIAEAGGVLIVRWTTTPGGFPGVGNDGADPQFLDGPHGDYSLSPGSPAIDSGDPADVTCGTDVVGGGRRVDGLLDSGSRVDRGAFEFSHVRLQALQPVGPADPIGFDTTGTAGLPVSVFLALGTGELCLEPYGTFLVDLGGPWILRFVGLNPTSVSVPPFPGASGITAHLQAVATTPDGTLGTTSNVDTFTFP